MHQTAIVTYTERFACALATLCTERPPISMCHAWLSSDDEALQEWVLDHLRNEWATGIGTIDAARVLADSPEEGKPEYVNLEVESLLIHLKSQSIPMKLLKRSGWVAKRLPAGVTAAAIREARADDLVVLADADDKGTHLRFSNFYTLP